MDKASPPVSPKVVAIILMIQKASATSGTSLSVAFATSCIPQASQFAQQLAPKRYYSDKIPFTDCGSNTAKFRPMEAKSCCTADHQDDHNHLLVTATVSARNELPTSSAISVFRPIILAHRKHPYTIRK